MEMDEPCCSICLTEITEADLFFTICYHAFHVGCLHTSVNHGTHYCPYCRNVRAVMPFLASETDIDASNMAWKCDGCGKCRESDGAIVCEGHLCLRRGRSEYDAHSMCYDCAGVTDDTAGDAPAYVCARCSE
jgi:hypothetical protein